MATVGIIANPMAGRDIRRLVARGRFVPNHEKVNLLVRVLTGLEAAGVDQVVMMPDSAGLGRGAVEVKSSSLHVRFLEMPVFNDDHDSTRATRAMASMNVGCLVTLGGDGTNRAVAKESGQVPIVPVSTGTNNAFPAATEGTVAGLAAGVVATGIVDLTSVAAQAKLMEIRTGTRQRFRKFTLSEPVRTISAFRQLEQDSSQQRMAKPDCAYESVRAARQCWRLSRLESSARCLLANGPQ